MIIRRIVYRALGNDNNGKAPSSLGPATYCAARVMTWIGVGIASLSVAGIRSDKPPIAFDKRRAASPAGIGCCAIRAKGSVRETVGSTPRT